MQRRPIVDERGAVPLIAVAMVALVGSVLVLFLAMGLLASTVARRRPVPNAAPARGVAPPGAPAQPPGGASSGQFTETEWATDVLSRPGVPVESIGGAANRLYANGAGDPSRLRDAIWNYNHASWYVDKVLELAAASAAAPAGGAVTPGDAGALLNNPNISFSPGARQDLVDGVIDQRVIDFLSWAAVHHQIAVSTLKSGHSQFVNGTDRVSNHWHGRAADIAAVDGDAVTPSSAAVRAFAEEAVALGQGCPNEIGLPWSDLTGAPGVFSDADHQNHIHAGWSGNPPQASGST